MAENENHGLPPGWEVAISRRAGIPYYYNSELDTTSWEIPSNTDNTRLDPYLRELAANAPKPVTSPDSVACLHLLQKHNKSRRPYDPNKNKVERSRQQARDQLKNWMNEIGMDVDKFKEYAVKYSDCSSGKRGGDLGTFGRNQMQKAFEDAAFALQVGQFSPIVSTDSGEHIIYRYR